MRVLEDEIIPNFPRFEWLHSHYLAVLENEE